MPDTFALQQAFAAALVDATAADELVGVLRGDRNAIRDRIAIYRGNIAAARTRALRNAYPIVAALVGDAFFDGLSRAYLLSEPASAGDLNHYGATFPTFVAAFPHAGSLPYLPDVARMEWSVHRAHYAADGGTVTQDDLQDAIAADPARIRPRLHPACDVVTSVWPIQRIWDVHQPGHPAGDRVDLGAGGETVLIERPAFRPGVRRIEAGESAFLAAALGGRTLGDCVSAAFGCEPAFDLARHLRNWINGRTIVGLDCD
jgi:hypothetical protein